MHLTITSPPHNTLITITEHEDQNSQIKRKSHSDGYVSLYMHSAYIAVTDSAVSISVHVVQFTVQCTSYSECNIHRMFLHSAYNTSCMETTYPYPYSSVFYVHIQICQMIRNERNYACEIFSPNASMLACWVFPGHLLHVFVPVCRFAGFNLCWTYGKCITSTTSAFHIDTGASTTIITHQTTRTYNICPSEYSVRCFHVFEFEHQNYKLKKWRKTDDSRRWYRDQENRFRLE